MTAACQVDFYVIKNDSKSADQVACWLAIKAWQQGHRIAVLAESVQHAEQLDTLMWDFPPGRFLPHDLAANNSSAPVVIATAEDQFEDDRKILVNMAESVVPEPGKYQRLLEIVPAKDSHRDASRQKYRAYRELGLTAETHSI